MRRRVAVYGVTGESLQLIPLLEANPEIEIAVIVDPDPGAAAQQLGALGGETASRLTARLTEDPAALAAPDVHAVIDGEVAPPLDEALPKLADAGVQIVSPLTARLLWGYGGPSQDRAQDRKAELLQALHEIVESVNLTVDADELFIRMLEIAMSVTGADGGSVMLLDDERRALQVRVAIGVERELWPKIRVALGEGIAGRVAANARPIRLRGKADRQRFRIVRERFDVESALCVPLVHEGRVLGVLNLHHSSRPEAFSDEDTEFAEQLGRLDAEIIARAQEHERLRSRAGRYEAVREVRRSLAGAAPLAERLGELCRLVAERLGGGIATVYLFDADVGELRLAATSLSGGGFGGEYRVVIGQGVDGRAARNREPAFLRGADGGLAYAALPLVDGDSLLGVLSVQAGEGADGVTPPPLDGAAEETLLEMAAAAGAEIAHASREARMSARTTQVSAINEAGIQLISARELSDVTGLATSSGALILQADHAVLRLQDVETRRYVIRSYYGGADGRQQEQLFRLDKNVTVSLLKGRRPLLLRDLSADPDWTNLAEGFQSVMAAPLVRDGRVIGTLALYDKVAADQFYVGSFGDGDLEVFVKYVSYVERAVANALFHASARQHRSVDEDTGLPNQDYLERRIDEEVARAGPRERALAVMVCRIANLDEIRRATDPIRADRVVRRTADALRSQMRDFDVVARSGEAEFGVLLPEPGDAPEERMAELARSVAEEVAKDDRLNETVRIALAFGYAVHPAEGEDRGALLAAARTDRIHML